LPGSLHVQTEPQGLNIGVARVDRLNGIGVILALRTARVGDIELAALFDEPVAEEAPRVDDDFLSSVENTAR
jgi:hypothetical protein